MGISGNGDAKLAEMRKQIGEAVKGGLKARLHKAAAAAALTELQLGFKESVDPSGMPWAKLQLRDGMPLRKTGRLANSFTGEPTEAGFKVGTNVTYAGTHQNGKTIVPKKAKALRFKGPQGFIFAKKVVIPKREMVPWPRLSKRWSDAIQKAVDSSFKNFWERLKGFE